MPLPGTSDDRELGPGKDKNASACGGMEGGTLALPPTSLPPDSICGLQASFQTSPQEKRGPTHRTTSPPKTAGHPLGQSTSAVRVPTQLRSTRPPRGQARGMALHLTPSSVLATCFVTSVLTWPYRRDRAGLPMNRRGDALVLPQIQTMSDEPVSSRGTEHPGLRRWWKSPGVTVTWFLPRTEKVGDNLENAL